MTRYIAILRGINVGGHRKILMADLKKLVEKLGCSNVRTYIQSGNVIFDYAGIDKQKELGQEIESAIKAAYGYDVPVIVRTREELEKAAESNPFLKDKSIAIERLSLTFLSDDPTKEAVEKLCEKDLSPDMLVIDGKDVFGCVVDRFSDSKLTNSLFEKTLKVRATTRNWKTVRKLVEIARGN